jgi:hypothetical protein
VVIRCGQRNGSLVSKREEVCSQPSATDITSSPDFLPATCIEYPVRIFGRSADDERLCGCSAKRADDEAQAKVLEKEFNVHRKDFEVRSRLTYKLQCDAV